MPMSNTSDILALCGIVVSVFAIFAPIIFAKLTERKNKIELDVDISISCEIPSREDDESQTEDAADDGEKE